VDDLEGWPWYKSCGSKGRFMEGLDSGRKYQKERTNVDSYQDQEDTIRALAEAGYGIYREVESQDK
jgi:hypothetical protein